jgi:integrase
MHALEPDMAAKVLATFDATEIGAAVATALGSGLRRGELLALQWGDVDLDAGTVTVHRAIERVDETTRLKEPKTKRSRRTVALPAFVVERLRAHRLEQAQRFLALGLGRPAPQTFIFEREGQPWVPNAFGELFRRGLANAGLPHIRLHDLRHGFATLMLRAGVDLKTVSSALGHTTLSTTADIYAHVSPALMREAAARLDESLGSALRKASGDENK